MITKSQYIIKYENYLHPASKCLETYLNTALSGVPRVDKISARAKSPDRFFIKANKTVEGVIKYTNPLEQIQDIIGARVVGIYKNDAIAITNILMREFRTIEHFSHIPDDVTSFGYEGFHMIAFIPNDIFSSNEIKENCPRFFELQIKTVFQHAWGEANHDLGYKPDHDLSDSEKRKMAFAAAQAWGADVIFDELRANIESGANATDHS